MRGQLVVHRVTYLAIGCLLLSLGERCSNRSRDFEFPFPFSRTQQRSQNHTLQRTSDLPSLTPKIATSLTASHHLHVLYFPSLLSTQTHTPIPHHQPPSQATRIPSIPRNPQTPQSFVSTLPIQPSRCSKLVSCTTCASRTRAWWSRAIGHFMHSKPTKRGF